MKKKVCHRCQLEIRATTKQTLWEKIISHILTKECDKRTDALAQCKKKS